MVVNTGTCHTASYRLLPKEYDMANPYGAFLAVLTVCLLARTGFSISPPAPEKTHIEDDASHFIISKETTFFTQPKTNTGYIDYASAVNQHFSGNVTPEINANILFWQAIGPAPDGITMDPKFFKLMGMAPPSQQEPYFLPLNHYLTEKLGLQSDEPDYQTISTQQERTWIRPWTTSDYPHLSSWLKVNADPLLLVTRGTQLDGYSSPMVIPARDTRSDEQILLNARLPGLQRTRQIARALATRAMLHTGEQRLQSAWENLIACHRLGRLVGQGPTLIEILVGQSISQIANRATLAFIERAGPDEQQVTRYLSDLDSIPRRPDVVERIDITERCGFLDAVQMMARSGSTRALGEASGNLLPVPSKTSVEWDTVMRTGNQWYDRIAQAMRRESRAARNAELAAIEKDVKQLVQKKEGFLSRLLRTRKTITQTVSNQLVALFLPAVTRVQVKDERTTQEHHNLRIAFALSGYHHTHKSYPDSLEKLTPRYLSSVPKDRFSDTCLKYVLKGDGYLLYSIGENQCDDNGNTAEDTPKGDDLVIQIPSATNNR